MPKVATKFELEWKKHFDRSTQRDTLQGTIGKIHCFTISFDPTYHKENCYRWKLTCLLPGADTPVTHHPSADVATTVVSTIFKKWITDLVDQ